ncbi:MAG: carbohydrate ABC transporter permease [Anaerolineae bacterium]|nr:carbohydrate ABC transporter permease [Anaerolineae bacterium]
MATQVATSRRAFIEAAGGASYRTRTQIVLYIVATIGAVGFGLPFFWTAASSLKSAAEIYSYPPAWLPAVPQWKNYALVFELAPFGRFILNTVFITVLSLIGQVFSSSAVAFGFTRFRFPGRDGLFFLVLSTMMIPWPVTIVPTFLLFRWLNWIDTFKPLIIPEFFGGGAFFIFLLRQFFMTIPKDFDEAARIDGSSSFRIYWNVILPLSRPALATVMIFSFLGSWNQFIQPLIFLNNPKRFTVAIGLRYFNASPFSGDQPREAVLMAGSIITAAPCLALFFMAQQYFVKGIVMSGIKG